MKEASIPPMIEVDGVALRSALRNTRARVGKLVPIPAHLPAGWAWRFAVLGDVAALAAALSLTSLWLTPAGAVRAWAALPIWLAAFAAVGLYDRRRLAAASSEARLMVKGVSISVAATGLFILPASPRLWLGALWAASLAGAGAARGIFRLARSRRPVGVLVVGTNKQAQAIGSALARGRWSGYRALGFVEIGRQAPAPVDGLPVVGSTDRLEQTILETGAHALVIVAGALPASIARRIHDQVRGSGLECWTTALAPRLATWRMRLDDLDGNPVLALHGWGGARLRETCKRALDILGSATALLLTAPLFAAIAVAIKVDDPSGPVFFRQTRVGKDRKSFRVMKFRTMVDRAEERLEQMRQDNDADGLLFKMRDDPRVTRVGRFLRRTSLDELPQLWNVLVGDMSLVGPRPALPEETDRYEGRLRGRLKVKPGMTGLWQVNGRQDLTWADYVHYDLFYAENWSMALDVAILARTLPAVVRGRGAW